MNGCAWLTVSERSRPLLAAEGLAFEPVPVEFAHAWDKDGSHHLTGAAVLDVDGDGREEVFVGGGLGQADAILSLDGGRVVPLVESLGLSSDAATYGSLAIDWDQDGDVDLFVCRQDGLTLYRREGARFRAEKIPLSLQPDAVPMAVTAGDMDGDGDADLYVSVFISGPKLRSATYNDPDHAKANVLLRNDGAAGLTDVTDAVTASLQNTFTSAFVDLDGDRLPELVIAQNTGEVELLANRGGRFERVPLDTGFGFWMGLAVGDIDADGDMDLFFSNLGNSIPGLFTRGDLAEEQRYEPEWALFRNDGDLHFSLQTEPAGLTGYGFSWGAVFEDLDADGRLDLLIAENYVKWPFHGLRKLAGKALLNRGDGAPDFFHAEILDNAAYGQSPVTLDLDGDGRLDVLWLNNDSPSRALLNRGTGRFVHVALPDDTRSLGARVWLEGVPSPTRQVLNGTGLGVDVSPGLVFGLPGAAEPTAVVIEWADGRVQRLENPPVGKRVEVTRAP